MAMKIKDYLPTNPKEIVKIIIVVIVAGSLGVIAMGTEKFNKLLRR